jgi:hypothetical protein
MNLKNKYFKIAGLSIVSFSTIVLIASMSYKIFFGNPVTGKLDSKNDAVAESIQVSILNACGEDGIASKARTYLRLRGFDVVEVGNYSKTLNQSVIIDRLGDIRSAHKTAYALGIGDSLVYSNPDSSLYLRNTILIGKDFKNLEFAK